MYMGDPRDGWGGWNDYRTLTIKDAFLLYQEDRGVRGYLLTLFSPILAGYRIGW